MNSFCSTQSQLATQLASVASLRLLFRACKTLLISRKLHKSKRREISKLQQKCCDWPALTCLAADQRDKRASDKIRERNKKQCCNLRNSNATIKSWQITFIQFCCDLRISFNCALESASNSTRVQQSKLDVETRTCCELCATHFRFEWLSSFEQCKSQSA